MVFCLILFLFYFSLFFDWLLDVLLVGVFLWVFCLWVFFLFNKNDCVAVISNKCVQCVIKQERKEGRKVEHVYLKAH